MLTFSSEATLLGTTLGVKPQVLADIINNSTGECWSSKVSNCYHITLPSTTDTTHQVNHPDPDVRVGDASPPAQRNYEGGFVTKLAHKDLGLAVSAANLAHVPLELGKRCEEVYRPLANSKEWGGRDFSGVLQALKDRTQEAKLLALL